MRDYLIITGASKGIGKSIVALFQQHDWTTINISRHSCELPRTINYTIDLAQPDWQEKYATELQQKIKDARKICLVHNAALYYKDNIANLCAAQFRQMLEVNVVAPTILNRIFLPHMKNESSIIYIGSTLSEKAVKNAASYVIAKHALVGMMKATCQDLEGTGIHTSCVCPGFTDTEMLRAHLHHDAAVMDTIATLNAAKRLIKPEEIAEVVLFCAQHPVINGAVLHAHLGQIER